MDGLERDDDYEYGYDYLYEEEKPSNADENAEGLVDDGQYDDDEPDDSSKIESVLAAERIMQEINVRPLNLDIPENAHGRLKREVRAEALRRYEEAAQSPADFMAVIATWDKLDQNRERRERYNEVLREEDMLEYGQDGQGIVFPRWMMDATYRQLSRGNFLDYLADCPYEMHDLTSRVYLRKIIEELKEEHKEIFFFLYLRQYNPQRLAAIRGQTDRNIRKVRDVVLRKLRRKVYNELKRLNKYGYAMNDIEREFYDRYEERSDKEK